MLFKKKICLCGYTSYQIGNVESCLNESCSKYSREKSSTLINMILINTIEELNETLRKLSERIGNSNL